MDIHEYQSKEIFDDYNILTPNRKLCFSIDQIKDIENEIGFPCFIKAQLHSGARGKSGLVKKINNLSEAMEFSKWLFGALVITSQISESKRINKLLVEKLVSIKNEMYISISLNRAIEKICLIFSPYGGVNIEKNLDNQMFLEFIDPITGINDFQIRNLFFSVSYFKKDHFFGFQNVVKNLVKIYLDKNANLVEVNPLVLTSSDEIVALDAKISIDDNSLFKQKDISNLRDVSQENIYENLARENDLSYVSLDGNIGCIVNGAGLAMATMDIIKINGGFPANFLDIGGNCNKKKIVEALKIIISNSKVKSILVNIFGGIVKCDLVAEGLIEAKKELNIKIPIIVRLEGTNKELAKKILLNDSSDFNFANNLFEAALKAINL